MTDRDELCPGCNGGGIGRGGAGTCFACGGSGVIRQSPFVDDGKVRKLAQLFHEVYENRAPAYGWETQERSRVEWDELPANQQGLMFDVIHNLLRRGAIKIGDV